jgi:hypothetical protein
MSEPLESIFQTKYEEFAESLIDAFPELNEVIKTAVSADRKQRVQLYKQLVMPGAGSPSRDSTKAPGMVLPGVFINDDTWASCTEGTKKAINQFLSILTFSIAMKDGKFSESGFSDDAFKSWADDFMNQWRGKMDRGEFDSFTKRFGDLFGSDGGRLPPFPEKLRKGKLVKLAEEIVKELKPEEFGLDPETIKQCEADPSKAFEVIMNTTMRNPEKLQGAMKRIMKRLQEKFQRGEFKPQELAAEAEEMMKEFSENPAFVDLMNSMRKAFSFEDNMEGARAAGMEQSVRLNIVKERLRRKAEANAAARSASVNTNQVPVNTTVAPFTDEQLEEEFTSILSNGGKKSGNNKKHGKK